jgi:hypothetical protein
LTPEGHHEGHQQHERAARHRRCGLARQPGAAGAAGLVARIDYLGVNARFAAPNRGWPTTAERDGDARAAPY